MRRIVTTNAYAYVSGLPVDAAPFTVRQGLARLLVLADVGAGVLDDFEADWREAATASLPAGLEIDGEAITADDVPSR